MLPKLTIAFLIIFICTLCQLNGYLNLDTSWLITASQRLLSGETLNNSFVETNPPLIVYITALAVNFGSFFGLEAVSSFIVFISALSGLSLWLTAKYEKDNAVFLGLVFALVAMPTVTFGQREHLLVILTLPYFYLLITGEKRSNLITIMAAIGFAIKPFFVIYWAAFALADAVYNKKFTQIFRTENFIIGGIIAVYVAYLVFVEKTYVNEILPMLVKYYAGINFPMNRVLKEVGINFFFASAVFWVIICYNRPLINKKIVFAIIGLSVSCINMILQQKIWTNYLLPISFFGVLLNIFILESLIKNYRDLLWNKVCFVIAGLILAVSIFPAIVGNYKVAAKYKDENTEKMIAILNQNAAGKMVYSLSFDLGALFPAVTYSDALYKGKYPHLWMLPGMYLDNGKDKNDEIIYRKEGERTVDEMHMIASVLGDLAHNPPTIIIVTDRKYSNQAVGDFSFDFIKYFSQSYEFKDIFKDYKKIGRVGDHDIYKYKY